MKQFYRRHRGTPIIGPRRSDNESAPAAWELTTGSDTVVVAVIDTGIDLDHPDLAGNLWVNPGEVDGQAVADTKVDPKSGSKLTSRSAISLLNPHYGARYGWHRVDVVAADGTRSNTLVVHTKWKGTADATCSEPQKKPSNSSSE